MSDAQQHSTEDEQKRALGRAFIKKLIIGKVIFLGLMGGIAYYLFQTI